MKIIRNANKFLAYFDVIEEIDAIIDKQGATISAEIHGYVSISPNKQDWARVFRNLSIEFDTR